jgi:Asp/Glu/hydantoin racemase
MITKAVGAQRDGADAVIVDCMSDPGIEARHEAV